MRDAEVAEPAADVASKSNAEESSAVEKIILADVAEIERIILSANVSKDGVLPTAADLEHGLLAAAGQWKGEDGAPNSTEPAEVLTVAAIQEIKEFWLEAELPVATVDKFEQILLESIGQNKSNAEIERKQHLEQIKSQKKIALEGGANKNTIEYATLLAEWNISPHHTDKGLQELIKLVVADEIKADNAVAKEATAEEKNIIPQKE